MNRFPTPDDTGVPGRTLDAPEMIGVCCVDSAQLILIDPSYLRGADADAIEQLIDECRTTRIGRVLSSVVDVKLATVVQTGHGDGCYPVYAQRDRKSGRVMRVEVRFDEVARSSEADDEPAVMMAARNALLGIDETVDALNDAHPDAKLDAVLYAYGVSDEWIDDADVTEKLAQLVTRAYVEGLLALDPDAFGLKERDDTYETIDRAMIDVARLLTARHSRDEQPVDDEAAILDGPQGFEARLRVEPDGLRRHMHEYVDTALRSQLRAEANVREPWRIEQTEAQTRRDEAVMLALHELIDGMLDAWRVWDVVDDHRMAQRSSMYALRYAVGVAT